MTEYKFNEGDALKEPLLKEQLPDLKVKPIESQPRKLPIRGENQSAADYKRELLGEDAIEEQPQKRYIPADYRKTPQNQFDQEILEKAEENWESINNIFGFFQNSILLFLIIIVAAIGVAFAVFSVESIKPDEILKLPQVSGLLNFKNLNNMEQVLAWMPFVFLGCGATTAIATYIARQARSREIDWTDSHLMLEYSGPLTLALKWTAIKSIDQIWQFDIFHGRQPVFLIKTYEENVFKLKESDITAKHNVGTFFSLIKANAPDAEFNVDSKFVANQSYTELWLKYFSKPTDRERSGLLDEKILVADGMYRIMGTVGGGGQGTAYLAVVEKNIIPLSNIDIEELNGDSNKQVRHFLVEGNIGVEVGQEVILKEYVLPVHRGQLTAERTAQKLKAEAEILQKLDHPNIVKLKDAFIEDYRGYLVMDYVRGDSLKTLTDRQGPQNENQVILWAIQILETLSYMHHLSPPVVHRDVTPDNLMLQEDGNIKIVDFNVAYQVDSSATATVVGKHAYIPAEQFRGKPCPQSDIYSLGGTMFYLLTGKEPEPISKSYPARVNDSVSEELDRIVAKATSTSLQERYAAVEEFADDLKTLIAKA